MSNIQCEWVHWEEQFGATYSDERTQVAQCGNLIEAGRDSARECLMAGGGGEGANGEGPRRREGILNSALAEKPNKYLEANRHDDR